MAKNVSRRDFLKGTAAGALTAAFAGMGLTGFAEESGIYTPGTYSATASGMDSDITVTMTFDANSITDVTVDVSGETPGIGAEIADRVCSQILETQSAQIDGVAGATVSSDAVRTAALACIAQAKGEAVEIPVEAEAPAPASSGKWYDEAYFAKPDAPTDISEVYDFEVVVVGAGNGGCPCAISCADLGAKIAWVERAPGVVTWAGEMGAYNSKVMKEKYGIEYTEEELQEIINTMCANGSYDVDQRLIALWVHESGRTMDWFTDMVKAKGLDMFIETDLKETRFMTKVQTHTVFKEGTFEELGPNVMGAQLSNPVWIEYGDEYENLTKFFHHSAEQLIQDETGRVTGIYVRDTETGNVIQINASKGVILATGGYSGNPEMMDALRYRDKDYIANNFGATLGQGDGIKMAMWAGADIDRNHASGCWFDRAAIALDHHVGAPYASGLEDIWWPGSQPWLNLNALGERFANEDTTYDYHCWSWLRQPGHYAYQIFDSNYWEDVKAFHSTICSRVVAVPGARNSEVLPGIHPAKDEQDFYDTFMAPALASGKLKQADSIEELARLLDVAEENIPTFVASVDRYNQLCEEGLDADFGKQPKDLRPVKDGPFYGIALGAWILSTFNGVRINTNMEAIKEDGKPVGGLYIVGNDSGGFISNSYPQLFGGTAHGRTVCFARLAALHACTGSIYEA